MSLPIPDPVALVEDAAALLDGLGPECERLVEDLVREFQYLDRLVSRTIFLAGRTVESIQASAISSIPSKIEKLVGYVQGLVRDRLETNRTILRAVRSEKQSLGILSRLNNENNYIAKEIWELCLLTKMEVERLDESGRGFAYLAGELGLASEAISAGAREIVDGARVHQRLVQAAEHNLAASLPRLHREFQKVEDELQKMLGGVKSAVSQLSTYPAEFKVSADSAAERIAGVVSAIQSHDITRQQAEHVKSALAGILKMIREADGMHTGSEIELRLRVQAFQLENAKSAMESWSSQIRECLDGLLQVSASRLESIAPLVLQKEGELSTGLGEIERVERECEIGSLEATEGLSGLSDLVGLVERHAQQARATHDRLRLLSVNSMVESRQLGSQADVILEISKNITRVFSRWGEMAERSRKTKVEIQNLIAQTGKEITMLTHEGSLEMRNALADIGLVLDDMKNAATSAAESTLQMGASSAAFQQGIEGAGRILHSISSITARIARSVEGLHEASRLIGGTGAQPNCNLAELEADYLAGYTTEMERNILREALYGEMLPVTQPASIGNGVELF